MAMITQKPRRRRRRGSGKKYFTEVHEQAIIDYVASDCVRERTELYNQYLGPVFDELRDECKIWLITILDKYDPNKGSKAFSYFSVITKNWFIHKVKKQSKKTRTEIEYIDLPKDLELKYISTTNPYAKNREHEEFFNFLKSEIDSWEHDKMKENEEKVLNAIRMLFDSANDIEIFNKKAIYLYLREITGLNTKQVVNNLNKMRIRYRVFREKWDKGDL